MNDFYFINKTKHDRDKQKYYKHITGWEKKLENEKNLPYHDPEKLILSYTSWSYVILDPERFLFEKKEKSMREIKLVRGWQNKKWFFFEKFVWGEGVPTL